MTYEFKNLSEKAQAALRDGRPYRATLIDESGDLREFWLHEASSARTVAALVGWEIESVLYYGYYKEERA